MLSCDTTCSKNHFKRWGGKNCALEGKYIHSTWLFQGWNYHEISVRFCNNWPKVSLRTFSVPQDYFRFKYCRHAAILDAPEYSFESYSNVTVLHRSLSILLQGNTLRNCKCNYKYCILRSTVGFMLHLSIAFLGYNRLEETETLNSNFSVERQSQLYLDQQRKFVPVLQPN